MNMENDNIKNSHKVSSTLQCLEMWWNENWGVDTLSTQLSASKSPEWSWGLVPAISPRAAYPHPAVCIYFRQEKSNDFVFHMNYLWQKKAHIFLFSSTDGADKNGTLVFIHFSAQAASISIISVAIMQRRSWGFQNTPNLQSLDYFEPSYGTSKKSMFWLAFSKSSIKIILGKLYFL